MRGKSRENAASGAEAEQPTAQRVNSSSSSLALQLSSSSAKGRPDEEIVEQKLSEKLLDGFLLLEKACPCCATPLVKQEEESADPALLSTRNSKAGRSSTPTAQDADSLSTLQATVTPIAGIPFCVTCQAHIVTDEVEAVALQERYAGQTVQGKIMVAISGGQGCLPPIGTTYGNCNNPSKAGKKSVKSHKSKKSSESMPTETRDKDSVPSSPRKHPVQSPALLNKKDTIEMFRSSISVCRRQTPSVPTKMETPLSQPESTSITTVPKVDQSANMQESPAPRHAPEITIEQGECEEIEVICAESTMWQQHPSEDDVETREEAETELSDEDSLRVMTSQDGQVETKEATDGELKPQDIQDNIPVTNEFLSAPKSKPQDIQDNIPVTNEFLSAPKSKENETDAAAVSNPKEEQAKTDKGHQETNEALTFEEVCVQATLALEKVRSDDQATENKDECPAQEVGEVPKPEAAETPKAVIESSEEEFSPEGPVAYHDDVHEISIDQEDLMVGSGEDLTTEGSHSVEHDDGSWPSYEERKAVATKVLGVKIMQGYSLLERQCPECTMPLTEYRGSIYCVVCPVLHKKSAQSKQHRSILAREMARVKLETQMMEQRKVVQANKNKLLEKTKKLGNTLSSSCVSSSASAKANGTLSDTSAHPSSEKDRDHVGNPNKVKEESEVTNTGSKSASTSVARTTTASNVGQARVATRPIITSKALTSSGPSPAAEGTLTSPIRSKSEDSNKSKMVVKADSTMSTSITSSTNASNQSKTIVKAQSALSATAAGSPASHQSKVVVKALSLLRATTATATSTPATDKSSVIRINSLKDNATVNPSPASSKCKSLVKANSLEEEPAAVSTSGSGMDPPINKAESASDNESAEKGSGTNSMPMLRIDSGVLETRNSPSLIAPKTKPGAVSNNETKSKLSNRGSASTQLAGVTRNAVEAKPITTLEGVCSPKSKAATQTSAGLSFPPPKENKETSRPVRPVMALVKVTPQPAPAHRKRTKNQPNITASVKDNDEAGQKVLSSQQGSENSSKLSSSVYSDSTISTKSKISRSTLEVAVVEHIKEAKAEATMEEKVNLAIGPNHIRSLESDDSSEKNLSVATPMDQNNCMTTMFNAAIGPFSREEDAIKPPTQQELHRLNLEEIRLLKEAIQAEKAMHEKGIQKEFEEGVSETKHSPKAESREKFKKHKHKKAMKAKESAKVVPKSPDKTMAKPKGAQEEKVVHEGTIEQKEVKEDDAEEKEDKVPEKEEETEDKKESHEKKNEAPGRSLMAKSGVLAKAIAEADKRVIAEAEDIVRSFAEDHHEDQSITLSQKEIRRQQFETLRSEGRAAMTRRTMTGWTVSSELCLGKECASSPLVMKGSVKHCVVCGGTGTGKDGVYDLSMDDVEKAGPEKEGANDSPVTITANHDDTTEKISKYLIRPPCLDLGASTVAQATKVSPSNDPEKAPSSNGPGKQSPSAGLNKIHAPLDATEKEDPKTLIRPPRLSGVMQAPESDSKKHASSTKPVSLDIKKSEPLDLIKPPSMAACSPTEIRMMTVESQHPNLITSPLKKAHHDIESKRAVVSKEIGKRMLKGWKLLDLSCPTCLMPLMIDENDENEVCVLCGLVTEGIQSTGTESTMQPTLSFKSTEDTDSILNSPVSFKALSPIGMDHNLVVRHLATSHIQKPDEPLSTTQKSPAEKSNKKSTRDSQKSSKKSKRKSSKEKSSKQDKEPSIGHLAASARSRVDVPKSDPPASRAHNVVRRSVLEADAVKAGDTAPRFDGEDASPRAPDKACGPSPSMNTVFDSDPSKKSKGSVTDPSPAVGTSKACGPSPSIKKTFDYDWSQKQGGPTKLTAIDPPIPSPNIATQVVTDVEKNHEKQLTDPSIDNRQDESRPPQQQENLMLEIPKEFDVNDEGALRQLIAQAKLRHPHAQEHVQTAEAHQTLPVMDVPVPAYLSKDDSSSEAQSGKVKQGETWNCHLPSPGLQIKTMGEFSEQTMDAIYHLPSPGMTEASFPLQSPASYHPRSVAPELRVHTSRSSNQIRPRIAPESMDRPRASCRSKLSSGGGVSVSSSSASYTSSSVPGGYLLPCSQSRQRRLPRASPGAYSGYHIERKTPQSPEIIVISGMDDLASCAATSVAATSVADSISTEVLDTLLARIEETKSQLDAAGREEDGVEKQEKIAGLLYALSSAAAQMEMLDDRSATSIELLETPSVQQGASSTASSGSRSRRYRDV